MCEEYTKKFPVVFEDLVNLWNTFGDVASSNCRENLDFLQKKTKLKSAFGLDVICLQMTLWTIQNDYFDMVLRRHRLHYHCRSHASVATRKYHEIFEQILSETSVGRCMGCCKWVMSTVGSVFAFSVRLNSDFGSPRLPFRISQQLTSLQQKR